MSRKPNGDRVTEGERKVFAFLRQYIEEMGYAPTVREIMRGCGWHGPVSAQTALDRLEERGCIVRESRKSRTIRIVGSLGACPSRTHEVGGEWVENV